MAASKKEVKKVDIKLAALSPYIVDNVEQAVEKNINGKDFVGWGENNRYFEYLYDLYANVPTLQTVINGAIDYTTGDGIEEQFELPNAKGETFDELIDKIVKDYWVYGGYALEIIKDLGGNITSVFHCPFDKLRSNKKNDVFFYSDDWGKSYGRVSYITLPKYQYGDSNQRSIYYFKDNSTKGVYPVPVWNSARIYAEIEKKIGEFHLNEISNNFLTSKIINFNGGVPDDNLKAEIERNINEKFSGEKNAGRVVISFNESKENETTIADLTTDDFDVRYETLAERAEQQIYAAFRATPNLFGVPTKTTGFNQQEYDGAFKLFNRTMIAPVQKNIQKTFRKIFNMEVIRIKPFNINFEDEQV